MAKLEAYSGKKPFRRMFWKIFVCNTCENSVEIMSLDIGQALDFSNYWYYRAEFSNSTVNLSSKIQIFLFKWQYVY